MIRLTSLAMAALCAAIVAICPTVHAATITIAESTDNFEAQRRSDSGLYIASENNAVGRVGFQSNFNGSGANAPGGIMPVVFFQLPALAPWESITGATFSVGRVPDSASSAVTPTFNGDLYALGLLTPPIQKTAAEAQKYFYLGDTAQTSLPAGGQALTGSVSRLANDFLIPADFIPNGGTATTTPDTVDVTAYIQNLYADPVGNGFTPGSSYLVLRVNPDASSPPTTGTQRYSLPWRQSMSGTGTGTPETQPLLTLQTIPEPASGFMAAVALAAIRASRRRVV